VEIARQVLSVLAVFGLLGVVLWALRRAGTTRFKLGSKQGRGRALESVERLALTPQHSLHLVKIRGREVVVATHPHGCSLLSENPQ
jgi:flagellar biogenesis protein FliO